MHPCPNCGQSVAEDKAICANCGADAAAVWPPPIDRDLPTPPPLEKRLVTGHVAGDFAFGFVVSLASLLVAGWGLLLMPILYLALRMSHSPYRAFTSGIGWGSLIPWGVLAYASMDSYTLNHYHW